MFRTVHVDKSVDNEFQCNQPWFWLKFPVWSSRWRCSASTISLFFFHFSLAASFRVVLLASCAENCGQYSVGRHLTGFSTVASMWSLHTDGNNKIGHWAAGGGPWLSANMGSSLISLINMPLQDEHQNFRISVNPFLSVVIVVCLSVILCGAEKLSKVPNESWDELKYWKWWNNKC